ncbi:DUF3106 domain-containing protein [Ramlibacter sp. XY19]|uniref:DUF3106 domain-containing protein n=1 Tax=Ramlibacter paludis TaxID=2908000 RepID=UPI0023DAD79F|nr:DUF3106 domain-containing protein [Ramlibacter paludis]MCG2593292.1 DUF3106 domain-containing protein [Ramlibacter paludis]
MTPPSHPNALLAAALLGAACLGSLAWAADPLPAPSPSASQAATAKPPVAARAVPARPSSAPKAESSPTWAELSARQKQALEPLAASWSRLGEAHKRKWLAVSSNFPTMPPGEQARLHSRMAEWAALSPQQRTQARLNFAEAQTLPSDDKRAKWEAYQALPPEEKKKLAAGAGKPVPPTAAAVQPVQPQKLAATPKGKKAENRNARIAVAPGQIDHNTLLPQPGTLTTPSP